VLLLLPLPYKSTLAIPVLLCCWPPPKTHTESVKPRGMVDLSKVQDVKDGRSMTGKANTVQLQTASGGSVCYVCDTGGWLGPQGAWAWAWSLLDLGCSRGEFLGLKQKQRGTGSAADG
jgi:hypothetical protein